MCSFDLSNLNFVNMKIMNVIYEDSYIWFWAVWKWWAVTILEVFGTEIFDVYYL
jgi:hypothetical protein